MNLAKRVGVFAMACLVVTALVAPGTVEARGGRYAARVFGGFVAGALIEAAVDGYWGPYPYYYGYPAPSYYYPPGPFYAPYYGCYPHMVWTGRHWRRRCY